MGSLPRVILYAGVYISVGSGALHSQTTLKWDRTAPSADAAADSVAPRSRNLLSTHILMRTGEALTPDLAGDLNTRGLTPVQEFPQRGLVVTAGADAVLDGVSWQNIAPAAKLSTELSVAPANSSYLVEFFPDVDMGQARAIVADTGMTVLERTDLIPNHLLVSGNPANLPALSSWDEVAYVFPASDDLVQGVPLNACAGAATSLGAIGQVIVHVGNGWGSSVQGWVNLFYSFQALTEKLPSEAAKAEFVRAFQEWGRYIQVNFTESQDSQAPRTLSVLFARGAHGDSYPFDGPGGIIAHTFYPAPINPEPIAGDLHFDADENWRIGASLDLFSAALHETGHALGLGHSDRPGAVMYPYYRQVTALSAPDIQAIQEIYAPRDSSAPGPAPQNSDPVPLQIIVNALPGSTSGATVSIAGTVTGGNGGVTLTWSSDRGASGVASGGRQWRIDSAPLAEGNNTFRFTAATPDGASAAAVFSIQRIAGSSAPMLRITSPANGSTAGQSVTVQGSASSPGGIARIEWTSDGGAGGLATGSADFQAGPIPLREGENRITVRAVGRDGAASTATVQIFSNTGASVAAVTHAPPSLTVTKPAANSFSTSADSITISGTAASNNVLGAVRWSASTGASGIAQGLQQWTTEPIPLFIGTNVLTIRASDTAGNESWRAVVVTRR